ncbi:MAG: ATP/GTP-binding protein [Chitinophagales bacterium]
MLLEFEIENFRSIKEKQVFSLVAESSKSKPDNVFEQAFFNGDLVRLLKAAVVYGANASGKSNLIKAFDVLRSFVLTKLSVDKKIPFYAPFLFDEATSKAPTSFVLTFIGPKNHKFRYEVQFNGEEVLHEELNFYPKGQKRNLFKRPIEVKSEGRIHTAKLGQDLKNRELSLFRNQLVLSKFGVDEPDELLSDVYLYFSESLLILKDIDTNTLKNDIANWVVNSTNRLDRLSKLIRIADTKIKNLSLKKTRSFAIKLLGVEAPQTNPIYDIYAQHSNQKNGSKLVQLSFEEESKGTNVLFALGGKILQTLEEGGILFVDEIDTSLHPKLAKFLVLLFQHPVSNPKNAQLIFTTHETTFLDKDLFRKDQIWFTEKNDLGETDLFSAQDFEDAREDTPFDKWYMAGKFGGIPQIKELEFIFQDGTEK